MNWNAFCQQLNDFFQQVSINLAPVSGCAVCFCSSKNEVIDHIIIRDLLVMVLLWVLNLLFYGASKRNKARGRGI